jgi:hypothetical protein
MVNGKRDSVNSAEAHPGSGTGPRVKQSQSEASPTSSKAINPPRSNAARIHTATCGRLRISPRGGSLGRAKSSESSPVSSTGWRAPLCAPDAASRSCGSLLNSGVTASMLAPKKTMRQGKACGKRPGHVPEKFAWIQQSKMRDARTTHARIELRASDPKFQPAQMPQFLRQGMPESPTAPAADTIVASPACVPRDRNREESSRPPLDPRRRALPWSEQAPSNAPRRVPQFRWALPGY